MTTKKKPHLRFAYEEMDLSNSTEEAEEEPEVSRCASQSPIAAVGSAVAVPNITGKKRKNSEISNHFEDDDAGEEQQRRQQVA